MLTLIFFLALQSSTNNPLGIPLGPNAAKEFIYLHWDGQGTVPRKRWWSGGEGKLAVDYSFQKLVAPPSCKVDDLDAENGPVKFENVTKDSMTLVAPVGHELKWDCRSRIPKPKAND